MITTVKLDGRNYLAWSQSARMFIESRKAAWSIPLNHEIKQEKEPRELVQLVAQVRLMINSTSKLIGLKTTF